jgi:hypothetical protein
MRAASQLHKTKVIVQLQTNVKAEYADNPNFKHPSGAFMLTPTGADMLSPLLLATDFIGGVQIADSFEEPTYNFDKIRDIGLRYQGSISRWYFYAFPELTCDLSEPIEFKVEPQKTTRIVINRTERYHNPTFDYRVLIPFQHIMTFIGLPNEYEIIKRKLPALNHVAVNSFLDTAAIIKGCHTFIGNQSMSYAIAEIMGHNRILEVSPFAHNCIPMTPNGYDCMNLQNLIEHMKRMHGDERKGLQLERASIATDEQ